MPVDVDPAKNLGHARWVLAPAPAGEDGTTHVFWACAKCGFVVGFWRDGFGCEPVANDTAPAENVGAYTGQFCT